MTTREELRSQARRYAKKMTAIEADREKVYAMIRERRAGGASLRELADDTGVSFGRIQQIVRGTTKGGAS